MTEVERVVPASKAHEPLLSVRNLTVTYSVGGKENVAVDNVSFTINRGEVFGLAGESGSGKSTIANAIMRLLQGPANIASGSILFDGKDILGLDDEELRSLRWRDIAMVFQSAMNSLNPVMTIGAQIVDVFGAHSRLRKREAWERAGELLRLVDVDPSRLKSYPHQLSGGQRQRAVIAIALALNPTLLIMDEPTTALDVIVQQEIMDTIIQLQREFDFAVLFITHDLSLMVELSQTMAIMYSGRIVELAPARELFSNPLHPYTAALMNAFPPMTGPRRTLTGLSDASPADLERRRAWATADSKLQQVRTGHWLAPVPSPDSHTSTDGDTP